MENIEESLIEPKMFDFQQQNQKISKQFKQQLEHKQHLSRQQWKLTPKTPQVAYEAVFVKLEQIGKKKIEKISKLK